MIRRLMLVLPVAVVLCGWSATGNAVAEQDPGTAIDPAPYSGVSATQLPGYFFRSPTRAIACTILDQPEKHSGAQVNCFGPESLSMEERKAGCPDAGPKTGVWSLAVGPGALSAYAHETSQSGTSATA